MDLEIILAQHSQPDVSITVKVVQTKLRYLTWPLWNGQMLQITHMLSM